MSLKNLRVLLVDDDADQLDTISSMLASANHSVLPAGGLAEASEALSNQQFDAVVLGSKLAGGATEAAGKLRNLEMNQAGLHTPILSILPELCDSSEWQAGENAGPDGYLPESFEPDVLVAAVNSLAAAVFASHDLRRSADSANLPIFEPEEFKAQVAYDQELMIEIIDLFLSEQVSQVADIHEAVRTGNFDGVYLAAHTIKGSLASLHAGVGRLCAEQLESAAKQHNREQCEHLLGVLRRDLEALEPALLDLRNGPAALE